MRSLLRNVGYGVLILPVGVICLGYLIQGEPHNAVACWGKLSDRFQQDQQEKHSHDAQQRPGALRSVIHTVLSVLLGVVEWVFAALILLMIARGALYGFVDSGPYDNAWGGPSLAGAWLAHAAISLPIIAAVLLLMSGVTRLHLRLTRWLCRYPTAWWVLPVTIIVCLFTTLFIVLWSAQV